MKDMLVNLLTLPELAPALERAGASGTTVRRLLSAELPRMSAWAQEHFGGWAAEIETTYARVPITCFIALRSDEIVGFAAYDASFRNFFGPTGVLPECRGTGVGRVLLLAALHAQREQGYNYSIIGAVGPAEYYEKAVGAQLLDGPAALLRSLGKD